MRSIYKLSNVLIFKNYKLDINNINTFSLNDN